jgi:hypothetical protein
MVTVWRDREIIPQKTFGMTLASDFHSASSLKQQSARIDISLTQQYHYDCINNDELSNNTSVLLL